MQDEMYAPGNVIYMHNLKCNGNRFIKMKQHISTPFIWNYNTCTRMFIFIMSCQQDMQKQNEMLSLEDTYWKYGQDIMNCF